MRCSYRRIAARVRSGAGGSRRRPTRSTLARKHAPKVAGQAVYCSSVTDPYLPAERSLRLTRGILEALLPHQPRLLIQTRGPLVVRDLDLLRQFRSVRVNMSIPTDSEEVRRAFEPKAPPLEQRWEAAAAVRAGGRAGRCVRDTDAAAGESGSVRGAAWRRSGRTCW